MARIQLKNVQKRWTNFVAVENFKFELFGANLAVCGKTSLDGFVDGGADLATRSIDRGPLPLFCRKRQPALGSNNRSIPLGFDRIVLEVVKRRADQPGLRCRLCLAIEAGPPLDRKSVV